MAEQTPSNMNIDLFTTAQSTLSHFRSLSRRLYPRNMWEVFMWAEEVWFHHGIYSEAIKKAVRYFLTDIDITGDDDVNYEIRQKYSHMLKDRFNILSVLADIGNDYVAFGNSFTSIHIPFSRQMNCPKCGGEFPLATNHDIVKWDNYEFKGVCPFCNNSVTFEVVDIPEAESTVKPVVIRWPPQHMIIKKNPVTADTQYFIQLSNYTDFVNGVQKGDPVFLDTTPMELINAVKEKKPFEFNDGEIFHMCNETVAYSKAWAMGWGLPHFMAEFETVVLISLLDRYNEAIITDYLVPFRIISPPSSGQTATTSADPMLGIGMGNFMGSVRAMLEKHRMNPTGWNTLPFPVEYQVLGGEAKNLAPVELMEHFEQRLLSCMGIPQEFFLSSLNNSAGPIIGFKMFERNWTPFAKDLDRWLTWFVNKVGDVMKWEKVRASLIPVTMHEDPELRQLKLNLAASKVISETTAFRSIGIDRAYEKRRLMEEAKEDNDMNEEMQLKETKRQANLQAVTTPSSGEQALNAEQMAQQAAQGGAPMPGPGGAPMPAPGGAGGGSGGNASVDQILADADNMANQILTMEAGQRKSQLIQLKKDNPTLHAQVKAKLEELERGAAQQGKAAARAGQMPPPQQ